MRFINGTKRKKTRFLWFPKVIGQQARWLERATWEEQLCVYSDYWWVPTRWIDEAVK